MAAGAPRFLLISEYPPWPADSGADQRTQLLWRALDRLGEVDLFLASRYAMHSPQQIAACREQFRLAGQVRLAKPGELGAFRLVRPAVPRLVDKVANVLADRQHFYQADAAAAAWLRQRVVSRRYDAIVGRFLLPTASSGAFLFSPVILDLDDVDTQRLENLLQQPQYPPWKRALWRRQLRQLRRALPPLLRQPEHIWLVNPDDLAQTPAAPNSVLPNIAFAPAGTSIVPQPPADASQIMVMVGSLRHRFNVHGVERFINKIWPRILEARPAARFHIVGSQMTDGQRQRWGAVPGVKPIGFVEDIAQAYAPAAMAICPIFEGVGTKIKVVECFMHGRTAVVTPNAHRGFTEALPDELALLAPGADEAFADACVALLDNPARRRRMAEFGLERVRDQFSFERFAAEVSRTVQQVLAAHPGGVRECGVARQQNVPLVPEPLGAS